MNKTLFVAPCALMALVLCFFSCTKTSGGESQLSPEEQNDVVPGDSVFTLYSYASDSCLLYGEYGNAACCLMADTTNGYPGYVLAIGDKSSDKTFYAYTDSTGVPYRIYSDGFMFDFHYINEDTLDLVYVLPDGTVVYNEGLDYAFDKIGQKTKAGNQTTTADIVLVCLSGISGLCSVSATNATANKILAVVTGVDLANTFIFKNGVISYLVAGASIGFAVRYGGALSIAAAALIGTASLTKVSINDFENKIAKYWMGNATPVTEDVVQVTSDVTVVAVSAKNCDGVRYRMKLGAIDGSTNLLTKNTKYQGFFNSNASRNPDAVDIPFSISGDAYYRAVLKSEFDTEEHYAKKCEKYFDFWYYGKVVKNTHVKALAQIAIKNVQAKKNGARYQFTLNVTTKALASMSKFEGWGIAVLDAFGNLVAERYVEGSSTEADFSFDFEFPRGRMVEEDGYLVPIDDYYAMPFVTYHLHDYFDNSLSQRVLMQYQEGLLHCPDDNHPHAIDLGLPSGTKWCCCNVGASSPEGYGGYYAWGETSENSHYDWPSYAYFDPSTGNFKNIGSDIAGTSYDVARVKMGGSWRMPTKTQMKELCVNCNWQWTTQSGVKGILVTGPNGGQLFLPAAGYCWLGSLYDEGSDGLYWSSTLDPDYDLSAYSLGFNSGGWYWGGDYRSDGLSVRAVCP